MKKTVINLILILCIVFSFCSCGKKEEPEIPTVENIKLICELSTLKSYYNNVAVYTKKKDKIYQKDRTMWIEYQGVADIGINMEKVDIAVNESVVTVTLPEAEILNIGIEDDTLTEDSYVVSNDGFFFKNSITVEEQQTAIVEAQNEMQKQLEANTELLNQARDRAKELITNYIVKIGEVTGVEYTINYV